MRHHLKGIVRWAVCLLTPFVLTGCWDSADLDNIVYVHNAGISYDHGQYEVWIGLLDTTKSSTQETKATNKSAHALWTVHGKGSSFIEVVNNIYPTSPKRVSWSQFSVLILHDSILRGPYREVLRALSRYREVRYSVWVYGAKDPLKKIFTANQPVENNPLYYYITNPRRVQTFGYVVPSIHLNELLRELHEPVGSAILPQIALNRQRSVKWDKESNKSYDEFSVPTVGVFRREEFAGWLPHKDLLGVFWARTGGIRIPLYLHYKPGSAALTTIYLHHLRIKVHPVEQRHQWYYDLSISGPADIAEAGQGQSATVITKLAERRVEKDIRQTYSTCLSRHVDIFNLTAVTYRRQFILWPPNSGQKLLSNLTLRPDSLRKVKVKLNLNHTGMRTLD